MLLTFTQKTKTKLKRILSNLLKKAVVFFRSLLKLHITTIQQKAGMS